MKTKPYATPAVLAPAIFLVLAMLGIAHPFDGADVIDVRTAEYTSSTSTLLIKATSSKQGVTLNVYRTSTDEHLGALDLNKDEVYEGQFILDDCPERITVKSSGGGRAVADVEKK